MRYTEEKYQAFLEELMQMIFAEYTKIGVATERWKSSFSVLRPDFGKKSASDGTEAKEVISQEELRKYVSVHED